MKVTTPFSFEWVFQESKGLRNFVLLAWVIVGR